MIKKKKLVRLWIQQFRVITSKPQPHSSSNDDVCAGRPKKVSDDSSFKARKRRVLDIVQFQSVGKVITAADVAEPSTGHRNVAKVIRK